MNKKLLFGFTIAFTASSAFAQYDAEKFGMELQNLKSRIEQKRLTAAAAFPGGSRPAAVPDSVSADQPAMLSRQISACQKTMDQMTSSAQQKLRRSESWAIAGAITGLLGAVGAGHISSIAVGLLSGTAGLSNTVQNIYKEHGDTPEAVLATRSGIRKQAITAIDEYVQATDDEARYDAMIKLHFSCSMYELTGEKLPAATNN